MTDEIITRVIQVVVAGIVFNVVLFLASVAGSWKLFSWRLKRVEDKLEKHNQFSARLVRIETLCPAINQQAKTKCEDG